MIFTTCVLIFLASLNDYIFIIFQVYALYSAIAWRSLKDETLPVAISLFKNNLDDARYYLSRVVGRDTENLNPAEIIRAAVETIAENLIDGVLSVLFFAALGHVLFGSVGMIIFVWIFKTASTLDSMVGYDNERYHNFGTAGARLDDIFNFIPARIGGIVIILAGFLNNLNFVNGFKAFIRDRRKHKSPNSAHGESAFAGLMGLKLGGGAFYNKIFEERPWLGDELKELEPSDILRAHKLMDATVALFAILLMIII